MKKVDIFCRSTEHEIQFFSQWESFAGKHFQTHWHQLEVPWKSNSSRILRLQNVVSEFIIKWLVS